MAARRLVRASTFSMVGWDKKKFELVCARKKKEREFRLEWYACVFDFNGYSPDADCSFLVGGLWWRRRCG